MISMEEDKKALLWFYDRYSRICKGRSSKRKTINSQIDQMVVTIDKYITRYRNSDPSSEKAESCIINLNNIYKWYSRVHKRFPDIFEGQLAMAITRMLDFLSTEGSQRLSDARSSIIDADNIPLYEFLSDDTDILKAMTADPVAKIVAMLESTASRGSLSALSSSHLIVCVTKTGKLYHRTSCPYCNGRATRFLSYGDAKADGYVPCRCMGKEEVRPSDSSIPTLSGSRILSSEVTVFIDESSIPNPWKWMDNDLSDLQGSYSYIICEGYLSSEKEISPMNTIISKACPSRWSDNSTVSSLEAITTVLEVLSFQYEFHGCVNIYTDNESIVKRWRDNPFALNLSASFKHISVEFIPRELNQQADSLLNQHVFSVLPKKAMTRIKKVVHENIKTCEELDYIHAFFSDPRKDIPALFGSLERLANMAGYNPYNAVPDMTPLDRLRMLLSMIRIGLDRSQSSETSPNETA